jgi:hypothetical protein
MLLKFLCSSILTLSSPDFVQKFYNDYPNRFSIVFEEENANFFSWDLITQAKGEKAKFALRLNQLWANIYRIPLNIEHC